jgi:phthalate 4,5-cis-dihydrodiol dehydrogenase
MRKINVAAVGLGRAFSLMAPAFADPRVSLVAGTDPRPEARARFQSDFGGRAFSSLEELLQEKTIDAVYIATPHQVHAEQACLAAAHGKHVLVEKPMALTLEQCRAMIDAARKARVSLIVGHSHSFDLPILQTRKLLDSGQYGAVRMITAVYFTDFLYRPRRPEELDSALGGGVVLNQGAHHVDIARLLGGGRVKSVRAQIGAWDPARPAEGAYSCLLEFDGGAFATLVYSGYGHFDADEFCGWIAESGAQKDPETYGAARRVLENEDEFILKISRNYGGPGYKPLPAKRLHQHFGPLIVSCEKADLRPLSSGIAIFGDTEKQFEPIEPPGVPRAEVIDELYAAVVDGRPPLHSGEWAMATLEVCLAMRESAREHKEIPLRNQIGLPT